MIILVAALSIIAIILTLRLSPLPTRVDSIEDVIQTNSKVRADQNSCVADLQAKFSVAIGHSFDAASTPPGSPERAAASKEVHDVTVKLERVSDVCFPVVTTTTGR